MSDTWSPDEWYEFNTLFKMNKKTKIYFNLFLNVHRFWATLQFNNQHYPQSGFRDIPNQSRINTMARFAGWGGI